MSVKELFDIFFQGRNDVIRVLLEPLFYAGVICPDDPASVFARVFSNFMNAGVYTFRGGTNRMIGMMTDELNKNNVDIVFPALVEKISINNRQVNGVIVKGKIIKSKTVVANSNLLNTVHDLIGDEYFSHNFAEKVKKVRLSTSNCQVYLGIKKGEKIPYIGDIIFTSTHKKFDPEAMLSKNVTSRTFSIYYPQIRPENNDYTIVASSNAKYEDWAYLSKEDYIKEKKKLIESSINCLEKYLPGIRNKIDHTDAATPLTFERYTLHRKGATYGTKSEGLDISTAFSKKIDGLFHAGSVGMIMSGWLGVVNYGVIVSYAIDKFLKKRTINYAGSVIVKK